MKTKLLYIVLLLSLGLNLGIFLRVGCNLFNKKNSESGPCMGYKWHQSPLKKDLNLTEEQTRKIQDYQKEMESQLSTIKSDLKQKRKKLLILIKEGNLNENMLDKQLKEISSLQGKLEKSVIQNIIKIKTLLTPEQLKKFNYSFEQGFCPMGMSEMPCQKYLGNTNPDDKINK